MARPQRETISVEGRGRRWVCVMGRLRGLVLSKARRSGSSGESQNVGHSLSECSASTDSATCGGGREYS